MNHFIPLFKGCLSRSKGLLLMSVVISIGIALIVVVAGNAGAPSAGAIKLGFIDRDQSAVSVDFARYLEDDLGIELIRSDHVDEMNTALVEKNVSGLVEIPAGFETSLLSGAENPVLLTFMDDYANEIYTRGYIDAYMQSLGVLSVVASVGEETEEGFMKDGAALEDLLASAKKNHVPVSAIEKDLTIAQEEFDKSSYRMTIGCFLMFSFIMSLCIARIIFSDRMDGTYRRMKTGCVTSWQYVSSVGAVGLLLMFLINIPPLVLITLFGGNPGISFAETAGMMGIYMLFVIGFGLLVGLVAQSSGGLIAIIVAVTSISSMLGGAWFPVDTAPRAFQLLGFVTPQRWFFAAMDSVQTGAGSPVGPLLILALGAALLFILSGVQFVNNKSLARV